METRFRQNAASVEEILRHFEACDPKFIAVLSARVDLIEYSQKIHSRALRHEAWYGNDLIGMVAIYCNDETSIYFITDVSVIKNHEGKGIASRLLANCIEQARSARAKEIRLEVLNGNLSAQTLYEKNGFLKESESGDFYTYKLEL